MRKVLICSLIFLVLALATTVPCALCARPPVSPWPPEEKWYPMPPWEALPPADQWIEIDYNGEYSLAEGESFLLWYGWVCWPTNVMYDAVTAEPATVPWSLQGHTDAANCIYTVTMDGTLLKPTGRFTANCQWFNLHEFGFNYIVPKATGHLSYILFPQGLAAGTYIIDVYGQLCWAGPASCTVTLTVED